MADFDYHRRRLMQEQRLRAPLDYHCSFPRCDEVRYDPGYAPQCRTHPHHRMKPDNALCDCYNCRQAKGRG